MVRSILGDTDRLYLKRKDGGRGLISVMDCVRMEEENLVKYVANSEEWMLMKVKEHKVVVVVGEVPEGGSPTYKKRMETGKWEKIRAKPLHGRFQVRIEKKDGAGKTSCRPKKLGLGESRIHYD